MAVDVGFGCACLGLSVVFEMCAFVRVLVWLGEERTVEAVLCSAFCTNLQAASARC